MRKLTRISRVGSPVPIESLEPRQLLSGALAGTTDPLYISADTAVWRPSTATIYISSNRDGNANLYYNYGVSTDTVIAGDLNGSGLSSIVAFRSGTWLIDNNRDGTPDKIVSFGQAGDQPLIGNTAGNGLGSLIIFRSGVWYVSATQDGALTSYSTFGQAGDIAEVGDFFGNGRLDRAVYRPSTGVWFIDDNWSGTASQTVAFGGAPGDQPFVADFNNNGVDNLGIFRNGTMYIGSAATGNVQITTYLGQSGDVPLGGYFDPSRTVNTLTPTLAVYRPATAQVIYDNSFNGTSLPTHVFGNAGSSDQIITGDFNADTVTDTAIFRSGTWLIDTTGNGSVSTTANFGQAGDVPLAGDFNNDGYSDLIVFRNGAWFVSLNQKGSFNGALANFSVFGQAGDIPVVGYFDGSNTLGRAVYRPSTGVWYVDSNFSGMVTQVVQLGGQAGDVPVAFDFNGDRQTDLAIFRSGQWLVNEGALNGVVTFSTSFGQAGDVPIPGDYSTANSIFVAQGGTGNGSESSPMGSVAAAALAAKAGQIIRIAPGNYQQQVSLTNQSNITLWGATPFYTNFDPTVGDGLWMSGSSGIFASGITFSSSDTSSTWGDGVLVYNSSFFATDIRTDGSDHEGIYSAAAAGSTSTVRVSNSNFDSSVQGAGIFVEESGTVVVKNSTADNNGSGSKGADQQFGRGIVVNGAGNTTTLIGVKMDNNADHGFIADGTDSLVMRGCDASNNPNANGAILNGNVSFDIGSSSFNNNGTTRGSTTGFNGIEVDASTSGGVIANCTFDNDTGYGVFVGAGTNVLIENNSFYDSFAQIVVEGPNLGGYITGNASALIYGNSFSVPGGNTDATGIYGSGTASAVIGGPGVLANTFSNFANYKAIFRDKDTNGVVASLTVNNNTYINDPHPIGGY
jgi:hypothetical protein